jgi:hypothetical protein
MRKSFLLNKFNESGEQISGKPEQILAAGAKGLNLIPFFVLYSRTKATHTVSNGKRLLMIFYLIYKVFEDKSNCHD